MQNLSFEAARRKVLNRLKRHNAGPLPDLYFVRRDPEMMRRLREDRNSVKPSNSEHFIINEKEIETFVAKQNDEFTKPKLFMRPLQFNLPRAKSQLNKANQDSPTRRQLHVIKKNLGLTRDFDEYTEETVRQKKLEEQRLKLEKSMKEIDKAKAGDH